MSKAFTKEDTESPEEGDDDLPALPAGFKNYMTPEGADAMREELRHLLHTVRPEVVRTVTWAASNGDRSENADYQYGKRRLREIDRRLRFLQKRLDAVEVVDSRKNETDQVLFGAWVKLRDEEGRIRKYRIVGMDETDPKQGYISWVSPMAKALLQAREGDAVSAHTPKGDEDLEILEVRYQDPNQDPVT